MNKRELELLGRALEAEVNSAMRGGPHIMQTRGTKLAEKMVTDGLLAHRTIKLCGRFPVTVKGFELTHAGRMAYCMTCGDGGEA